MQLLLANFKTKIRDRYKRVPNSPILFSSAGNPVWHHGYLNVITTP